MQLTAAAHRPAIGGIGVFDPQGHIGEQLLLQAIADLAAGYEFALLAREGGIVDHEGHLQGGFIHMDQRQGLRVVGAGDGFPDVHLVETGHRHEITGAGLSDLNAGQTLEAQQLGDAPPLDRAVVADQGGRLARLDRAVVDAADHDAAEKIAVIEGGHLQLQGLGGIANRGRHVAKDRLEERLHRVALGLHVGLGVARHAATEQVGEVALVVVGAEFQEEIENLVDRLLRIHPGAVDLVHEHDGAQAFLEGFLEHEAGLGHRPLIGINNQQTAIHHAQHPFHFAAEIGVAGGVNNIDANAVVINCSVLGENRDAALPLQVIGIEDAGRHSLTFTEDPRLVQQRIHQGGLAVVHVGDDRDIANRGAFGFAAHGAWVLKG